MSAPKGPVQTRVWTGSYESIHALKDGVNEQEVEEYSVVISLCKYLVICLKANLDKKKEEHTRYDRTLRATTINTERGRG